jgi:hypothetical protein
LVCMIRRVISSQNHAQKKIRKYLIRVSRRAIGENYFFFAIQCHLPTLWMSLTRRLLPKHGLAPGILLKMERALCL